MNLNAKQYSGHDHYDHFDVFCSQLGLFRFVLVFDVDIYPASFEIII